MVKYSVIISSHGRPALLARSLRGLRQQARDDLAVIVISDDQSAETATVAREFLSAADLFIARGGASGPARSRNLGLMVADSEYVLFLDDDDEWPAGFLASLDAAGPMPPASLRFFDFSVSMNDDAPVPIVIGDRDPDDVHVRNFIPNSCLVFPVDLARTLRFDESLIMLEDWDFLLAAIKTHRLVYVPLSGPIIHKGAVGRCNARGVTDDHLLGKVVFQIYQKWPAPTDVLRSARQALFASAGVSVPIQFL